MPLRKRSSVGQGYDLLEGAATGLSTGWSLVRASGPRTPKLERALDPKKTAGVFRVYEEVGFLVRDTVARSVEDEYAESVEEVVRPLAQIIITLDGEERAVGHALSILWQTLAFRGVQVLGVFSCGSTYSFQVPQALSNTAHDVVLDLRGHDRGHP